MSEELNPQHLEIVRQMIKAIGDDPDREGLIRTPERVVASWKELFAGYNENLQDYKTVFSDAYDQMIVCRGIEFASFCEHHMLPFFGTVSIGYIPAEGKQAKILGLSKLARITDVYARRLQIQERLTEQIADGLMDLVNPQGVAVIIEATHTCMTMRGVSKQRSRMATSALRGVFMEDQATRMEMLTLLRQRSDHE